MSSTGQRQARPRPSDSSAETSASRDEDGHRREPKQDQRRTRPRRNDTGSEGSQKRDRERERGDPKMVGQWRVGKTIGKGSSGRVRLAQHSVTKQKAAIKIVPKVRARTAIDDDLDGDADGEVTQNKALLVIEREIVIMKLISHPNVLRLMDVWETDRELFLIMELAEGGELFDYLVQKGRLHGDEALHYFQQVISGVDYCHRFNICHRDLKPENLLLDKDCNIKIADFGMAALQRHDQLLETSCGSPHYASPEIVAGLNYHGSSSDIWSCGVILFALLTGRLPFDDPNITTLLQKVKLGSFVMPQEIPPLARDLISRMLVVKPERRITMAEIQAHPWFTRKAPRVMKGIAPYVPPSVSQIERPVASRDDIDPEILGNLQTLWNGTPEESIIRALLSEGKSWEKVFYTLLFKYRTRALENYNMDDEDDEEDVPVARAPLPSPAMSTASKTASSVRGPRPLPVAPSPPAKITTPTTRRVPEIHLQEATPENFGSQVATRGVWNDGPVSPTPPAQSSPFVPTSAVRPPPSALSREVRPGSTSSATQARVPVPSVVPGSPYRQAVEEKEFPLPPARVSSSGDGEDQFEDAEDDESEIGDLPGALGNLFSREGGANSPDPSVRSTTPVTRPPLVRPRVAARGSSRDYPAPIRRTDSDYVLVERSSVLEASKENYRPGRMAPPRPTTKRSDKRTTTLGLAIQAPGMSLFDEDISGKGSTAPKLQKRKKALSMLGSPASPALSTYSATGEPAQANPKPSWLTSLFQWKSLSYTLQSTENVPSTREATIQLLGRCGVSVGVESIDGVPFLKCRVANLRDANSSTMRPVKFRVEFVSQADVTSSPMLGHSPDLRGHYPTCVNLVMEKGAHSTFKFVYNRLRSFWELDNPRFNNVGLAVRLIPSPMPSPLPNQNSAQALWS